MAPDDLLYAVVTERGEAALEPLLATGSLELRLPGSTKLLAARSLLSYFESAETLLARYGLVSPSICPTLLDIRPDWQSAFLVNLELQAAGPALSHTSGWPYFAGTGPLAVTLEDCYLAGIVTFLEFVAHGPFEKLRSTGCRKHGPLLPLDFARALLADKSWEESEGTSARTLLSAALLVPAEGPDWRAEVRRTFAILASTAAHANAEGLAYTLGLRVEGEVLPSATRKDQPPASLPEMVQQDEQAKQAPVNEAGN